MKMHEATWLAFVAVFVCVLSTSIIPGCKGYKTIGDNGESPTDPVNPVDPGDPEDPEDPEDPNKINYVYVKENIIRQYCYQCHVQFTFGGVDLSTYESAKSVGDRICQSVKEKKMPPAEELPIELENDLCEWVSSGFPQS